MSDPSWLVYAGAITGIVGAVTGPVGVVLAYFAFRRTDQLESLNLRLELRRTESTLQADIHDLIPLLERANASRTRLAAAQGSYHSGATKFWISQWETDLAEANTLVAGSGVLDIDCSQFSKLKLEMRLVTVHKLRHQVSKLADKYRDSLATDDIGREQLQANRRLITQARLDGKI